MFSHLAIHHRVSGSKVREHICGIAEIEIEVTTLRAFLRTIRFEEISRLAPYDMTRVCRDGGVFIRVAQWIVRKWFQMGMFRVLRHMQCIQILAILAIVCLIKVDWEVTDVE